MTVMKLSKLCARPSLTDRRSRPWWHFLGFVACLASGMMMVGCSGGSTNNDSPAAGGSSQSAASSTLLYGRGGDANTLDPINTDIGESVKVIVNLFDTLVTYHKENLELVPSLATQWTPRRW